MSDSLVSLIVPSYKHEPYILDCLQSLYDQTHKRLELIVIDDNSPDRTFEFTSALLSTAFADRFEKIVLQRQKVNFGAHVSLNIGLSLATGDYVAIVNSDDLFRPRRIEVLLAAMSAEGSDFAFSGVDAFHDSPTDNFDSARQQQPKDSLPYNLLLLQLRQSLAIAREVSVGYALLRQNVAISTGNFFFSRSLAQRIGGFQPLRYCHDWDFILQALVHTQPVFVSETLYDYRLHHTNTFRSLQHLAHLETEVVIRRFFKAILTGFVSNPFCPSHERQPGYFEAFIRSASYGHFWDRENALPTAGQRIYAANGVERGSSLGAFMRLAVDALVLDGSI